MVVVVVVVVAVHFGIILDPLVSRNSTNNLPPYTACCNSAERNEDRSGEHNPSTPFNVREKDENVDQNREQGTHKGRKTENQKRKQIFRRVRGSAKVSQHAQDELDEREERGDGVHNEKISQRVPGLARELPVVGGIIHGIVYVPLLATACL